MRFALLSIVLASICSAASACDASGPTSASMPLVSFLERLQSDALISFGTKSFDPKLYVDLPLQFDLDFTESAYAKLRRLNGTIPEQILRSFLRSYFGEAGADLEAAEPMDFVAEPEGFLPKVRNARVRVWALQVHSLWRNLSRRVSNSVKEHPERHTLLPLPNPVIVPGSRFREVYYWDSYWIIRGLLVSKMHDTAKAIVKNLIWLVDTYGHVLNGARAYYSNRSQPPLLSSMILDIYLRTFDLAFVRKSFPSLLKEYKFWISGIHNVKIRDLQGNEHTLSRFYAMWDKPRPESATIDKDSTSKLMDGSAKELFYREVTSTAETGWDFSSRWMSDSYNLTTLSTTTIVPADLNAYLYKMEHDIAFFAQLLGHVHIHKKLSKAAKARHFAMKSILWNPNMNQWLDYWVRRSDCEEVHQFDARNQNVGIFASNFIPMSLWRLRSDFDKDRAIASKIIESFMKSGLLKPAGIATSLTNNGQQWDLPNGWAPLQHMIIEGIANSGLDYAQNISESIAVRWIRTNYAAYKTTGAMHEKYDVQYCGKVGSGGEYKAQTGFGWSNGVLLALLEEFGWPADRDVECQ